MNYLLIAAVALLTAPKSQAQAEKLPPKFPWQVQITDVETHDLKFLTPKNEEKFPDMFGTWGCGPAFDKPRRMELDNTLVWAQTGSVLCVHESGAYFMLCGTCLVPDGGMNETSHVHISESRDKPEYDIALYCSKNTSL